MATTKEAKEPMPIGQRLAKAREQIDGYVKKDKEVQLSKGRRYKVVSHDAVTAHCRKALIDNGVLVVPEVIDHESEMFEVGEYKTINISCKMLLKVHFVSADDPSDEIVASTWTYGIDAGDAGASKALSRGVKSLLLKIFTLETGEDDESRVQPFNGLSPDQPITKEQLAELRDIQSSRGKTMDSLIDFIGKQTGREIGSEMALTLADYRLCKNILKKKGTSNAPAKS